MILAWHALLSASALAFAGPVQAEITGLIPDGRPVHVRVFRDPDAFPRPEGAWLTFTVAATAPRLSVALGELPAGVYAVSVHHDQDGDGELDFSWLPPGPAEGTSASCPSKPFAMPTWSSCAVEVGDAPRALALEMWY